MDSKKISIIIIVALLLVSTAHAIPQLACEFYGGAFFDLEPSPTGYNITAWGENGARCGKFEIVNPGYYGSLSCLVDDPDTVWWEGANPGDEITLLYNDSSDTYTNGTLICNPGEFNYVDVYLNTWYCGDGNCNIDENCESCAVDCGVCPTGESPAPPEEDQGGDPSGGGDSTSGGRGGAVFASPPQYPCEEDWACSDWTDCSKEGLQNRTCSDLNDCGKNKTKPNETQECVYPGDCYDNILNNNETGVDCGGPCPPCPSCNDGIMNQGEEGIDCGGPCPKCYSVLPSIEYPSPIGTTCGDNVCDFGEDCTCSKDCRQFSWEILGTALGILLALKASLLVYLVRFMKRDLPRPVKFQHKHKINKTFAWLTLLTSLFGLSITIFAYFTGNCWDKMVKYSWILLIEMVTVPIVGYLMLKLFEYSEVRRMKYLNGVFELINNEIVSLFELQAQELPRVEEELLEESREFRKTKQGFNLFENFLALDQLIDFISFVHENNYTDDAKKQKEAEAVLARAVEQWNKLSNDENFKSQVDSAKKLIEKIEFLMKQYEERNSLLEELTEIKKAVESAGERGSYLPKNDKSKSKTQ